MACRGGTYLMVHGRDESLTRACLHHNAVGLMGLFLHEFGLIDVPHNAAPPYLGTIALHLHAQFIPVCLLSVDAAPELRLVESLRVSAEESLETLPPQGFHLYAFQQRTFLALVPHHGIVGLHGQFQKLLGIDGLTRLLIHGLAIAVLEQDAACGIVGRENHQHHKEEDGQGIEHDVQGGMVVTEGCMVEVHALRHLLHADAQRAHQIPVDMTSRCMEETSYGVGLLALQ